MNYLTLYFLVFSIFCFLLVVYVKRHHIICRIRPQNYLRIFMINEDNTVDKYLIKKNNLDSFKVKDKNYFISYKNKYSFKGSYCGIYKYDNQNPIDISEIKSLKNLDVEKKFIETKITNLFEQGNKVTDFFKDYGIVFLVIGIVIIIYFLWKSQQG